MIFHENPLLAGDSHEYLNFNFLFSLGYSAVWDQALIVLHLVYGEVLLSGSGYPVKQG